MKHKLWRVMRARILAIVLICAVAASVGGPATAQSSGMQPGQSALTATPDIRFDQRVNNQIPLDLSFQDDTGKTVQLKQFFRDKRPVILVMPFFKCMTGCTLELKGMVAAFNKLNYRIGEDFVALTVSINPRETPALAAAQKAVYTKDLTGPGASDGWHFMVGRQEAIQALAQSIGFKYVFNLETQQFGHATGIVVLTPQGKAFRYFYGSEYSPRELRMALNEASNNNLGTVVDQLLQLCYHYDPTTGHYGLVIQRIIVAAGMATVVILASSILLMLRWERRNPRSLSHDANGDEAGLATLNGDPRSDPHANV